MSGVQPKPDGGSLPNNPFAGPPLSAAGQGTGLASPPAGVDAWMARANRRHWQVLGAGLFLFALMAGGVAWFVYDLVTTAQRQMQFGQHYTAETGRRTILESSNYLMQTRLLAQQVALYAQQTRKDREWFTSMQIESVNHLTNTALDLNRRLARQLQELTQTNLARVEQTYRSRSADLAGDAQKWREELRKFIEETLGQYEKKFQRYEPLLKIDPDIAPRIENALAQLRKLEQRQGQLELVTDGELKNLRAELRVLTEKLKLLESKLELLSPPPTNAPPRTNTPPPPP